LGEAEALKRGNTVGVRDQVMDLVAGQGFKVSREVDNLLPTPIVRDYKDGQAAQTRDGVVSVDTVARAIFNSGEVTNISWGKFAPAIERWEQFTRPAPAPTKPDGKNGNHRLSAEFTEWMMGLPQGWVTAEDIGLKRNDQLKACGNGVVPQQAELALNLLLDEDILEQLGK
jgi:DNA (cytosine-5)-methyltransferase 1